jgi:SAM-dependent methyltransferase
MSSTAPTSEVNPTVPKESTVNSQAVHRLEILSSWPITPGSQILEIGCGQGDCTTVLASLVENSGHIDAIDPAPLDYGSPWTLGQAQAHISASEVGNRITFHQVTPLAFLQDVPEGKYDLAVFVHSSWYFSSPLELRETFKALRGKARGLCIAEYALSTSTKAGIPHLLAALTRASLELHNSSSTANIRNAFSPSVLKCMAAEVGWSSVSERVVVPGEALEDGAWEVGSVLSEGFLEEVEPLVGDERTRLGLEGMREAVVKAVQGLGGEKARTMDVWVARFE